MPSGKPRDFEDTWKPEELHKSIKGTSSRKDKDRKEKDKDRDKDKERRKDRDKDKDRDKEKRPKDDDSKRRERRHRDKENGELEKPKDKNKEKEKSHRSKDESKDKDRKDRKHRDEDKEKRRKDDDGKERRHRDKDGDRHKDRDDDKKRRHRDEGADDDRRRRHRDKDEEDPEKERRRHRDERDKSHSKKKHQDEEVTPERSDRNKDGEKKERKKRSEENGDEGERERDRRRRHRDRETSEERRERKKREKEEEKRRKEKEEEEKRKQEEENGEDDYDYEDDFEDYDDDFEDDDGQDEDEDEEDEADKPVQNGKSRGEMDEVLRAMNEENERLMQQAKDGWSESEESEAPKSNSKRPKTAGRSFINFVSAKQRAISSKAANKAKERGSKLLEIIDMDQTSFDMFDMPPVNEYEMYMRSFGQSNTKQAYIQTNDDNIDRDVQTEEIETSEKWSQHPPEEIRASGGGDNEEDDLEKQMKPTDTVQLSKFLTKAGQVIAILLEESLAESSRNEEGSKKSSIYISEAFSELGQVPFLKGRRIICSQFATSQTHLLLTVHGLPKQISEDDPLASKGFLCVWNVNEPSAPQKVLVCESEPSCCCFSPTKATLAFAGMNEGSLAVWDLRESTSLHRKHSQSNREWSLRYPTYNTAGVLHYDNHQSGLRTVAPIAGPATNEVSAGSEEAGLSFQLATLEENSTLHLWVVAEITHPDVAGSESDLGLSPGGKIKLIKSSTIPLENPLRDTRLRTTMKSYELQLLPSDPSNYYVSTNTGCILHGVRYGGKAPPRAYRTEDDSQLNITCIDFSPFPNGAFLAGCSDGSLRLYATRNEFPLLVWPRATEGRPVTAVRWCRSRPSVFFVMDDKSHMYIWDLLMNETESLKKERISDHRVTSFALSNDHSATGIGTPERTPQMAIGLSTGDIEVHTISQKFSALMPEEVDQFSQLLNNSM